MGIDSRSSDIVVENRRFRLVLSKEGKVRSFIDKRRGRDVCAIPGRVAFCAVQWGERDLDAFARQYEAVHQRHKADSGEPKPYEQVQPVTTLTHENNRLFGVFGDTGVAVTFRVSVSEICLSLEVESVTGPFIDAITVVALPVSITQNVAERLNACYDDKFAACVLGLTREVNAFPAELEPQGTLLTARCSRQFGMVGQRVALMGCPLSDLKPVIQRVEDSFGLPSPKRGGVCAKDSEEARRSYLFAELAEDDVECLIDYAEIVPFSMIMFNVGSWAETEGCYGIHPVNFPDGEESLKRSVDHIHRAGMRAGMHIRCPIAARNDGHVTPVPDARLMKPRMILLAADVDEEADFLPTVIAPMDFPSHRTDGKWISRFGMHLQVGRELIEYRGISRTRPFGFLGCRRGACGTRPSSHRVGDPIYHLEEAHEDFVLDADTDIIEEVAERVAGIVDRCGFDMFYFDASERLQGPVWRYRTRVQTAYYDRFRDKDLFMQGSSYSHYTWHMMARQASADGVRDIKGYLDRRIPRIERLQADLMPVDLGWYSINERITLDDWEYVLNKALGYQCSVSVQTTRKALDAHPQTREILELIRDYEEARLEDYLSEADKAKLRVPGDQYQLVKAARGKRSLKKRQKGAP